MSKKGVTVKKLATEAGLDDDEVLLHLWEADIEVNSVSEFVPKKSVHTARNALGLATKRELQLVDFWRERMGMNKSEFIDFASSININIQPSDRRLPSGAISKLSRKYKTSSPKSIEKPPQDDSRKPELLQPFSLPKIGHDFTPIALTIKDVQGIHECLAEDFMDRDDPISPAGVRDQTLLESAVFRQETSFGDQAKYTTPEMMAAALTHSLVNNHAFFNGNKRTALVSLLVSLDSNGLVLTCDEKELFKFILKTAQHTIVPKYAADLAEREVDEIAHWICRNSKLITKGDRVISWRRCERILREYDCEIRYEGDKCVIRRGIKVKRFLIERSKNFTVQISAYNSSYEIPISTVKMIRRELQLDARNGVDTEFFYSKGGNKVDDFINKYRKTLKRLAKL